QSPPLPARPRRHRRPARVSRPVLEPGSCRLQKSGRADRRGGPMTMHTADLTVRKSITVEAPQERAFDVFTAGFDSWWPHSHHIGDADMADAVMECHEGGRLFERGVDGSECDWGRVLVFERPNRIVVSWHLQGEWNYDPDPEKASEYEVRFIPQGES